MDLKDFQLTTFTGTTFVVDNLEKVKTKGVELETTALLARGLTVRGALTYADTKYGAGVSKPDLAGQQLTHAPKWTLIGSSTYERNLSESLRAFLYFDMRYMSSYNTGSDLDIEKVQDSFAVFNGRIGIAQTKGAWKLELWAKNLFNKDYVQIVFDAPLQGSGTGPGSTQTFDAFLGAPRTFGATLRKQF
jgi:outer membrane receptor protein involved in Fe transport